MQTCALEKLKQEDHKFNVILSNKVRHCLKRN